MQWLAADDDKLVRGAVAAAMRDLAKYEAVTVKSTARQWSREADDNVRRVGEHVLKKID